MGAPTIRNPFNDPIGALVDTSLFLPVKAPMAGLGLWANTVGKAAVGVGVKGLESVGLKETDAQKQERMAAEAKAAEDARRSQLYNAATTDNSLDEISRRELISLYQNGQDSSKIASLLSAAREGKGIYAVRKINQAQQESQKRTPGRAQLFGSTGRGTIL